MTTRVYSVRKYRDAQPFTVMDDHDAEYYRELGFIVDESIIGDTPVWAKYCLYIGSLIACTLVCNWLFGWDATKAALITIGVVYALLLAMDKYSQLRR